MSVYNMMMDLVYQLPGDYWNQTAVRNSFEDLIRMAKEYDKRTEQSDCEFESKKDLIRKLAKELNVNINFGGEATESEK